MYRPYSLLLKVTGYFGPETFRTKVQTPKCLKLKHPKAFRALCTCVFILHRVVYNVKVN